MSQNWQSKINLGELVGGLLGVTIAFIGVSFGPWGLVAGVCLGVPIGWAVGTLLSRK